jgi:hypothetical protein
MPLALHHLHALGQAGSAPFFAPPRHEITISENVSRKLKKLGIAERYPDEDE